MDLVFVHVEAPDEAGHSGELKLKLQAIEDFDAKVVGPLRAGLDKLGDYRVLVLCDHFTPAGPAHPHLGAGAVHPLRLPDPG